MTKADLHVHSKYSNHTSEWLLREMNASESYTDPEYIYARAKEQGMDWVTITDHNAIDGSLGLKERHPSDVFTGVELTAAFPEDGCQVHVLVYGLDAKQFAEAMRLRSNIYELRDYLNTQNLACSVAHATYSVNGKLTLVHLEKLLLLFNTFEGINGGRSRLDSEVWTTVLDNLDAERLGILRLRHGIEPHGSRPWIKGRTAGSDDHGGITIARAYCEAEGSTVEQFLASLRTRRGHALGSCSDYRDVVLAVSKIAFHYAWNRGPDAQKNLLVQAAASVFEARPLSLSTRLKLKLARAMRGHDGQDWTTDLLGAVERLDDMRGDPLETRLDALCTEVNTVVDGWFRNLAQGKTQGKQSILGVLKRAYSSLPALLFSLPFGVVLSRMYEGRDLIHQLRAGVGHATIGPSRVLSFADTLDGAEGVSTALGQNAPASANCSADPAHRNHADESHSLGVITSFLQPRTSPALPGGWINVQPVCEFSLPDNGRGTVKVPSILTLMHAVHEFCPDEICLHTAGPVALLGLLAARLLRVRCVGHCGSVAGQAWGVGEDESLNKVLQAYLNWFYSQLDETVPEGRATHPLTMQEPTAVWSYPSGLRAVDGDCCPQADLAAHGLVSLPRAIGGTASLAGGVVVQECELSPVGGEGEPGLWGEYDAGGRS